MYRLIVTELAFAELEEAISYYKSKVPNLGYEFEEEVLCILDVIKHNPLLFPVKFEYIYETVVKWFPFVINYEIVGKQIIVSAIFHTKQNPIKKVKRERK